MSSDAHMSCQTCQDLLTELVCEELSAADAAAVRAHAEHCERCGPALEKMQRTLKVGMAVPLLTPPPEVEKRIMQAARAALQSKAKGPLREAPEPPRSGFLAWCARLGSWAMSPQVAMASVLLLMVGIGLYALPLGQDAEPAGLRAAEDEGSPADPRAPASSATATPMPAEAAEDREQERPDLPAVSERWQGETRTARPSRPAADARDLEAKGGPGTKAKAARSAVRKPSGVADDGNDAVKAMGGAGAPSPAPGAKAERSRAASGSAEDFATGNRFAPPPPAAAAPVAEHAEGAPAEAKRRAAGGSKGATSLSEGIAAARRGDVVQAEQQLAPIAAQGDDKERAQASLWLARSLRSAGDCRRALTYYRTLTQAADAPPAILEEAADCYQRTGDSAQANRLRARVASPPAKTSQ